MDSPSEQLGTTSQDDLDLEPLSPPRSPGKLRSLQNLRPPWQKGIGGNPSGLSGDGQIVGWSSVEKELKAQLARGYTTRNLVRGWIKGATKGNAACLVELLKRVYPITETGDSRATIFEGIRLEVDSANHSVRLELEKGMASFALGSAEESQRGSSTEEVHAISPEEVPSQECVPNPEGMEDVETPREVEAEVRESVRLETPGSEGT